MSNFDDVIRENRKWHNANWPEIPDYPNRILIVGDSRSGKKNALLKLINHKPDIGNIFYTPKIHTKRNLSF